MTTMYLAKIPKPFGKRGETEEVIYSHNTQGVLVNETYQSFVAGKRSKQEFFELVEIFLGGVVLESIEVED